MHRALLLTTLLLLAPACADDREFTSRAAVKALLDSKDSLVRHHRARLASMGRYVLPDIEQEYHSTTYKGRLRLLGVLEQINDPEALHLLRHIAKWDGDVVCRRRAKKMIQAMTQPSASTQR